MVFSDTLLPLKRQQPRRAVAHAVIVRLGDPRGWSGDLPDYKLEKLIADIETLLTPSTPVIAAALIALDRDCSTYQQHAEKARRGVTKDALLTRNIDHIS